MTRDPELGCMVTAKGAKQEPFHRWMSYRQGFSPELVRRFLRDAGVVNHGRHNTPLLDPFSGSGTFVLECARRNIRALGIEAMAALAFLSSVAGEKGVPELPDLGDCATWEEAAERLELPVHRAALMYTVGRQHTSAGKLNRNAPPLLETLDEVVRTMRDDMRHPLPLTNPVWQGDARKLDNIDDGSIGGILTSPPYLSRHDYTKVLSPYETVYQYWYSGRDPAKQKLDQIAAHPGALTREESTTAMPTAVDEVSAALLANGQRKLATVAKTYFQNMFEVLIQCRRVLLPKAPCWMVVGGARLKSVYVPSDLILADAAASCGFEVRSVCVARNLIDVGRRLGRLTNVTPRESILELRKR